MLVDFIANSSGHPDLDLCKDLFNLWILEIFTDYFFSWKTVSYLILIFESNQKIVSSKILDGFTIGGSGVFANNRFFFPG
jgi:hypothetical protein